MSEPDEDLSGGGRLDTKLQPLTNAKNAGIKHAPSLTPSADWGACELHRFTSILRYYFTPKRVSYCNSLTHDRD